MLYTVGEMARFLNVSASTLRYYDKEGLLPFVERSNSGIRMFSDKDYEWLKIIECLKKSGLSIKEIRSYIDMTKRGDDSLEERLQLFEERKKDVERQMRELQETLDLLKYKCWYYEMAIQDQSEERVRSLSVEELPEEYKKIKNHIQSM
ncbi:MerR family transcriptional regulator [Faecalitalea cylindroides]|uniref:MerR family transcriptional regulator n=1 Tax=Faecalitalea cylindroides TaxID=39483 RepID=UPI000B375BEE|nr:MerR family transcriptional regulator [Faecalitalea cylindroides]MDB7947731.1 MerR family transcriptional regulator [Faecalitalea cylindroides]MDB7949599.1 MerR family transcriptional regulator [Faecalitalea cylindroides]MDB7950582.1 MerR family transcriptional regulator [Faecalitalea cylindroides]OUN58754.1 MerR family transcriptional regulator [Faecalitalea cylindroides]